VSRAPQGRKLQATSTHPSCCLSNKKGPQDTAFEQITVALTSVIKAQGLAKTKTKQSDKIKALQANPTPSDSGPL
jgi:hypothetical protein